jgi:hypothetical protein
VFISNQARLGLEEVKQRLTADIINDTKLTLIIDDIDQQA